MFSLNIDAARKQEDEQNDDFEHHEDLIENRWFTSANEQ